LTQVACFVDEQNHKQFSKEALALHLGQADKELTMDGFVAIAFKSPICKEKCTK
jgi:hypothetical protein